MPPPGEGEAKREGEHEGRCDMVSARDKLVWCGALAFLVCGAARGAITVGGEGGAGGRANSFVFPWSDEFMSRVGDLYVSYDGSAAVSGAAAWAGVVTSSTADPAHTHEWPWVCRTFYGSGYASVGVNAPDGASANAGSHVNLVFESDYTFGISFKTTGVGRITLMGPGDLVVADCEGNNEIIGFLPAGRYSLEARANVSVTALQHGSEVWPLGEPGSVDAAGTYTFTVPGSGGVWPLALAALWGARRRR